ncbi:MAG: hypothetical protein WCV72_03245 [Patescibacteria group bacterium]|jgi:hypothetical protein
MKILKVALLTPLLVLAACGGEAKTEIVEQPKTVAISDVKLCLEVGAQNECPADLRAFPDSAAQISVSAVISNPSTVAEAVFDWRYLGGETPKAINSATIKSAEIVRVASSTLSMVDHEWPAGKYEVIVTAGTQEARADFTVVHVD